ncbi:MAG TPA: hypothetical protein VKS81_09295 [Bacteroidota bacterium]|nr:hypothetical protein [Bacteroidota bacterium]
MNTIPKYRLLVVAILVIACLTIALADIIRQDSFQAASNSVNITLHWITDDETNVSHFEIDRSLGPDPSFTWLANVSTKGPSLYEYVDNTAFKKVTTVYQYEIKIIFNDPNTNPIIVGPVSVTHSVSGVRRTWGSIKAMFR